MWMCMKTSAVPATKRSTTNVIFFYFVYSFCFSYSFNEMYSAVKWKGTVSESRISSKREKGVERVPKTQRLFLGTVQSV